MIYVWSDVQDILGRLDVKRRLGSTVAAQRGWSASATVPMLVFREDSTTRRRLSAHESLFAHLTVRGRSANGMAPPSAYAGADRNTPVHEGATLIRSQRFGAADQGVR